MAALIIALFLIVVVWGWFLIPKKAGAHKASTLSVRGRQAKRGSQRTRSRSAAADVTVVPVANTATGPGAPVPVAGGQRTRASARRRRVRTVLITAAVGSLAGALYTGSVNWWLTHAAFDAMLIIYYGLEMQLQDSAGARRVRTSEDAEQEVAQPALRRVAGG